ncbi:FxsA family protein [Blastococcus goldschmidtiae]|uniref:FxsA family protein n=1 Tax=Blastococcus goldschmidtiae TaxID=3075546 RepID=A0ABU2KA46_9ACTN|nr:FxsA family protein [Blastococcus sp. DSM 46792]MDT0277052.1 FxsA family protein [Blastococcus sp. DSM 46792]
MTSSRVGTGVGRRIRIAVGLLALAEVVVFVLVAQWIGAGATVLLALATSALGWALLARQGTRALTELRESARTRSPGAGRDLGNAGLVAVGGLLMVLPGFIGDLLGLLCLLPGTRSLVRAALTRLITSRLPVGLRPPVRVDSVRTAEVPRHDAAHAAPLVIEGEVLRGPDGRPLR